MQLSNSHLPTIHRLHGLLSEEEVDKVLVLDRVDKVGPVEVLVVVLLGPDLVLDHQGIGAREVGDGAGVELPVGEDGRGVVAGIVGAVALP